MVHITLLSDFGLQDASVASAKGMLMQAIPDALLTDISHMVEPYHVQQAAYLLNTAYRNFPAGSFHIVLCDVFSVQSPKLLLCEKDGHFFLSPDNGVLSLAFNDTHDNVWLCTELEAGKQMKDWLTVAGSVVNSIQKGEKPDGMGMKTCEITNALTHWQPRLTGNTIDCHVIHIDRFENVVINLTKEQFEKSRNGRPFRIDFVRNVITELSNSYADVRQDDMLCRFNSSGYMEIAINRGKAASLLGLKLSKEQHLIYNSIKVTFE